MKQLPRSKIFSLRGRGGKDFRGEKKTWREHKTCLSESRGSIKVKCGMEEEGGRNGAKCGAVKFRICSRKAASAGIIRERILGGERKEK